jgi:hypothetical protein
MATAPADPAPSVPQPTTPPEPIATSIPPTVAPLPTIVPPQLGQQTNEERWRAQQLNRTVFDPRRTFSTTGSDLLWYDPVNQQAVVLGSFAGTFEAQASFGFRGQNGAEALEIAYPVNQRYITGISPALVERIRNAGYNEWIETFVLISPAVSAR